MRRREGFVLLAVLWLMVAMASVGLTIALTSRDTISAAQNRVDLARAQWVAEGCIAAMRATIDEQLADRIRSDATWRSLDDVIGASSSWIDPQCTIDTRAAGMTLDVNTADSAQLHRVLLALHMLPSTVDSLVDALEDWRDPDDTPRPAGAERPWYLAERRIPPRNGPIASLRELARIRGFEALGGLDSVLGTTPGRISLARAPRPVLAALPGFSDELVTRIIEAREHTPRQLELLSLTGSLSPVGRDSLTARYAEVAPLVSSDPEAWIVTVRSHAANAKAVSTVEVRLARAANGVAILQHRVWP